MDAGAPSPCRTPTYAPAGGTERKPAPGAHVVITPRRRNHDDDQTRSIGRPGCRCRYFAHLRAPHFAPGTAVEMEITVESVRHFVPAQVVKTPFFNPPRKTQTPAG